MLRGFSYRAFMERISMHFMEIGRESFIIAETVNSFVLQAHSTKKKQTKLLRK
jgi:hypothetical protein